MTRTLMGAVVTVLVFGLVGLAAPEIAVDADTYDFGTILEGFAVEHTFILTNVGDETLEITQVRATCGCTTTALATKELRPGQSVELKATIGTTGFGGQSNLSKTIQVYSNDPRYAEPASRGYLALTITGSVLRAEPYHKTTEELSLDSYLLVDLRTASDYALGHLIGAVNVRPADLEAMLAAFELPESAVLFLYDETGSGAYAIAADLVGKGYVLARAFTGGFSGWNQAYGLRYVIPTISGQSYDPPAAKPTNDDYVLDKEYVYYALYVLIDLREEAAYAAGHLAGATNVPAGTMSALTAAVGNLPSDARIILYDETGALSDPLAQSLIASGYPNARSLVGGFQYWQQAYGDQLVWRDTP